MTLNKLKILVKVFSKIYTYAFQLDGKLYSQA